jgi:hypothetical protein
MKKIGFLSFGHWTPSPQSQTQSAADALLQSIDLAVEAERLGMDGAYFRVHHFAQQLASPFPLLAAVGAKTRKIEIGTAVIDMRILITWRRTLGRRISLLGADCSWESATDIIAASKIIRTRRAVGILINPRIDWLSKRAWLQHE